MPNDTPPDTDAAPQPVGRVASPRGLEATSSSFAFWVAPDAVVERTQIVKTECQLGDETVAFYGVVEEVRRRSRTSGVHEDFDADDGDPSATPPYTPEGVTYAEVTVLRAVPNRLTPPLEQSPVALGGVAEAAQAYGFGDMNRRLAIGRLRNGGTQHAGSAFIDLDYLLGENGGHLNVTGMTGVGTKSSFLLAVLSALLHYARNPPKDDRLDLVPVVFNVKGRDLLWIDRANRTYRPDAHDGVWDAVAPHPAPFTDATFFTPADPHGNPTIDGLDATAFRWSFRDVLEHGLLLYLFADDDLNERQRAVALDLEDYFTEANGTTPRDTPPPSWDTDQPWPRSWSAFLDWMAGWANDQHSQGVLAGAHHNASNAAVYRRLRAAIHEGRAIFDRDADGTSSPLVVTSSVTVSPRVVHIGELPRTLQRFVVAAVNKQIVESRIRADAPRGLRYVVVLDELNRFAPRGSRDPVTRLLEEISTERRSQGVLLFGAQQFASEVSTKVVESASVRALGRTGQAELSDRVWKGWPAAARQLAGSLGPGEKLVTAPTFQNPMLVEIPYPAWAMRQEDIATDGDGPPRAPGTPPSDDPYAHV